MSLKEFYTLADVEKTLNSDPNFLSQFDDDERNVINVAELPPDNMGIISNEEGTDEDLLEESVPTDVLGRLHINSSIQEDISNEKVQSESSPKIQKTRPKIHRTKSLWKKRQERFFSKFVGITKQ